MGARINLVSLLSRTCFHLPLVEIIKNARFHALIADPPPIRSLAPQAGLNWGQAKEAIQDRFHGVPSAVRYGFSSDTARLWDWLMSLGTNEFERDLSPIVEHHVKNDIGLESGWIRENLHLHLQFLCEEITEKTDFSAGAYRWKESGSFVTRIRFRKKV